MWERTARDLSHEDLVAEDEGWSVEMLLHLLREV